MKKVHIGTLFSTLVILLSLTISAYAGEPTDQLKQSVDSILDILRNPQMKGPEKTGVRRPAIRKIVNQRFDFEEMAKRSLALYWRQRTPEEKKEFTSLYSDLLERVYINRIESYTDEKIVYTGESIDDSYAVVKTKIITKKNVDIPIDYKLLKGNNEWKIYDVVIEGVSLINNYRSQFSQIIRSGSYEDLVKRLKSKQPEQQFKEPKKSA